MTSVYFTHSYGKDFFFFLSESGDKRTSALFGKLKKKEGIFSGSFHDVEMKIDELKLLSGQKDALKRKNIAFYEDWQKSEAKLEEKRNEAEKQWREKEKEFFAYTEELTNRQFEMENMDCVILSRKEGKGILSSRSIYIGAAMPDSLLAWSCAYEYLRLFIVDQILKKELGMSKNMKKKPFEAFCSVAVSLALKDSPFTISERNEFMAWCLSYDKQEWEVLKKCYPLWLSRESFIGFVEEARKAFKA